jgi:hypothetical protein
VWNMPRWTPGRWIGRDCMAHSLAIDCQGLCHQPSPTAPPHSIASSRHHHIDDQRSNPR